MFVGKRIKLCSKEWRHCENDAAEEHSIRRYLRHTMQRPRLGDVILAVPSAHTSLTRGALSTCGRAKSKFRKGAVFTGCVRLVAQRLILRTPYFCAATVPTPPAWHPPD
jgi:hypothetical protein